MKVSSARARQAILVGDGGPLDTDHPPDNLQLFDPDGNLIDPSSLHGSPEGGLFGQVLTKLSADDYDVGWKFGGEGNPLNKGEWDPDVAYSEGEFVTFGDQWWVASEDIDAGVEPGTGGSIAPPAVVGGNFVDGPTQNSFGGSSGAQSFTLGEDILLTGAEIKLHSNIVNAGATISIQDASGATVLATALTTVDTYPPDWMAVEFPEPVALEAGTYRIFHSSGNYGIQNIAAQPSGVVTEVGILHSSLGDYDTYNMVFRLYASEEIPGPWTTSAAPVDDTPGKVPTGGDIGQNLVKLSADDYDVGWADPSGGSSGPALLYVDDFSGDLSDWTVESGSFEIINDQLAVTGANGSQNVIYRPETNVVDCVQIAEFVLGDPLNTGECSFIFRRTSDGNHIEADIRLDSTDATTARLEIWVCTNGNFVSKNMVSFEVDGGMRVVAGQSIWAVARVVGDLIIAEYWAHDPRFGGAPVQRLAQRLTGTDKANFGAGISGNLGLRVFMGAWTNPSSFRFDNMLAHGPLF